MLNHSKVLCKVAMRMCSRAAYQHDGCTQSQGNKSSHLNKQADQQSHSQSEGMKAEGKVPLVRRKHCTHNSAHLGALMREDTRTYRREKRAQDTNTAAKLVGCAIGEGGVKVSKCDVCVLT